MRDYYENKFERSTKVMEEFENGYRLTQKNTNENIDNKRKNEFT
jgi:hypothetical protein